MRPMIKSENEINRMYHKTIIPSSSSRVHTTKTALALTTTIFWLALNVNVILSISSNVRPNLPISAANSSGLLSSAAPSSISNNIPAAAATLLSQQQQPIISSSPVGPSGSLPASSIQAPVSSQISNGAQLFQSPAALAALAAAAASANQIQQQQQMQALPSVLTARLDGAEILKQQQQQQQSSSSSGQQQQQQVPTSVNNNINGPAAPTTNSAVNSQQPYNMEQGKLVLFF